MAIIRWFARFNRVFREPSFAAGIVLLLAAAVIATVFLRERQKPLEETEKTEKEQALHTLTEEEKKEILRSLSAPEGAESRYTDEEKKANFRKLVSATGPANIERRREKGDTKIVERTSGIN